MDTAESQRAAWIQKILAIKYPLYNKPVARGVLSGWPEREAEESRLSTFELGELEKEWARAAADQAAEIDQREFFKPHQSAVIEYWSKLPAWEKREALLLIFGRDPRRIDDDRIEKLRFSPFARRVREVREILERSVAHETLRTQWHRLRPMEVISWADGLNLDFPADLKAAVIKYQSPPQSVTAANEASKSKGNKGAEKRQENNLLKLLAVLLHQHYKQELGKPSKLSDALETAAQTLDLTISSQTIESHVKSALELIPKAARPEG